MNFPSYIFLKILIMERYFMAASVLYGCGYLLHCNCIVPLLMETVAENSNPIESKYERQKILVVILSNIFKVKQYKSLLEVEKIYCLIEIVSHIHQNNVLVYLGKVISVDVYYFYFTFFTRPINVTSLIPDNHILHIRIHIPNN